MLRRNTLAAVIVLLVSLPLSAARSSKATTFQSILDHYEPIRVALVNDTMNGVEDHAKRISSLATEAAGEFHADRVGIDPSKADECVSLLPQVKAAADKLAAAKDLKTARDAFGELSTHMVQFRKMSTASDAPKVLYCPMVKESWLQTVEEIGNPYYGQKMARCGQVVED